MKTETTDKSNETKDWFFKKVIRRNKPLVRLLRRTGLGDRVREWGKEDRSPMSGTKQGHHYRFLGHYPGQGNAVNLMLILPKI